MGAQESDGDRYLQIQGVDATDPSKPTLDVLFSSDAGALEGATIEENGSEVEVSGVTRDTDPAGVVLVVDNSQIGRDSRSFRTVREAATEIVNELPENTQIAIVTVGGGAYTARPLTTDQDSALQILEDLTVEGSPYLLDGVLTASAMFEDEPDLQPSVVMLSGAPDGGSGASIATARGRAERVGAAVHAVGVGGADMGTLEELTTTTGGRLMAAGGSDEAAAVGQSMAATAFGRYEVAYDSGAGGSGDVIDLSISVDGATSEATFVNGSELMGYSRIQPRPAAEGEGISIFQNETAKTLAIVVALVAGALFAYGLISSFVQDQSALDRVLQPYSDDISDGGADGDEDGYASMAQTALLQRAVDITEDFAERQDFLAKAEGVLERANVPLRAAEAMLFYAVITIVVLLLAVVLTGNPIVGAGGDRVRRHDPDRRWSTSWRQRRQKQFMAQLPDTLQLLAGTLRAGYSLMQGVEAVSQEVDDPMGEELRRVITEARLGRPLEESLEASADRHGEPGLRVGRHGDPHPAGGRRQPGRAADDRRRDDDRPRAPAPRGRGAHRRGQDQRHRPRHPADRPRGGHVGDQPRVHRACCSASQWATSCSAAGSCSCSFGFSGWMKNIKIEI